MPQAPHSRPHHPPTAATPATPAPGATRPRGAGPALPDGSGAVTAPAGGVAAQLAFTSYLRVAAIVGVVLIHTAGLTYINDDLKHTTVWWSASLVTISTRWAVPVFVMVSGALLLRPPAKGSATLFYRRRLSRIGIPLLAWLVVYIIIQTYLTHPRPGRIFAALLRGESYTGSYFFWLILGLYFITPPLWTFTANSSRRAVGITGALLVTVAAANQSALRLIARLEGGPNPAGDPTLFTQFVPYIGFFLLGYALRDVIIRGRGRVAALAVLTAGLCLEPTWQLTGPFIFGDKVAADLNLFTPVSYQGWIVGLSSVAIFVLARSVIHPASRWAGPRAARWARTAGDLTLGVYASHFAILTMLKHVPGHNWPKGATTLTGLVVLCSATLLGAVAVTIVLKRIPLLRRTV